MKATEATDIVIIDETEKCPYLDGRDCANAVAHAAWARLHPRKPTSVSRTGIEERASSSIRRIALAVQCLRTDSVGLFHPFDLAAIKNG
jgi:hypothetical protein